jgi:hypothetical protein
VEGLRTNILLQLGKEKEVTVYSVKKRLDCHVSTAREILENFRRNGLVVRRGATRKPIRGVAVLSYRGAKPYTLAVKGKKLLDLMKYIEDHNLLPATAEFDVPREKDSLFADELRKGGFSVVDFEDMLRCGLVDEEEIEREPAHRYRRGFGTPDQIKASLLTTRVVIVKYRYRMR